MTATGGSESPGWACGVPGVYREPSIQCGWKQLKRELKDRPQQAQYIRSLTFVANTKTISVAADILPRLANLCTVTSSMHYSFKSSMDDGTAHLAAIGKCAKKLSLCKLDASQTSTSQNTLLCALQNLPNLIHLSTGYTIPHEEGDGKLLVVSPALPRLKTLSLWASNFADYGISIVRAAPALSQLVLTLSLDETSTSDRKALREMLQSEPLRVLEVEQHSWEFLTTLKNKVPNPVPNLEILTVAGSVSASTMFILWLT